MDIINLLYIGPWTEMFGACLIALDIDGFTMLALPKRLFHNHIEWSFQKWENQDYAKRMIIVSVSDIVQFPRNYNTNALKQCKLMIALKFLG